MAKKYFSKINKGGNTIYVKDIEAQSAISNMQSSIMTANEAESLFDGIFNPTT